LTRHLTQVLDIDQELQIKTKLIKSEKIFV